MTNTHSEKQNSGYPTIKDEDKNFLFEIREDELGEFGVKDNEVEKFQVREGEVDEYIADVNDGVGSDDSETTQTADEHSKVDVTVDRNSEFADTDTGNYGYEFEEADKEIGELLSPTWDYVFKAIWGNKNNIGILRNFLNSILDLGSDELDTVTLLNPQYDKTYKDEKITIFDIKATTKSGVTFDIELQKTKVDMMAERKNFLRISG